MKINDLNIKGYFKLIAIEAAIENSQNFNYKIMK